METLNPAQAVTTILQVRQGQEEGAKNARNDVGFAVDGRPAEDPKHTRVQGVQGAVHSSLDQRMTDLVEEFAETMKSRLEELNVDLDRRITIKVDNRHIIRVVNQHPDRGLIEDGLSNDLPLRERFAKLAEKVNEHAMENASTRSAFRRSGIAAYQAVTREEKDVTLTLEGGHAWVGLEED